MDEYEMKRVVLTLKENWGRRCPLVTDDPALREIFSNEALTVLHAACAADLPFPDLARGMSYQQWKLWLADEYRRNKVVMDKGVRAGVPLCVSPRVIKMWADDFLKGRPSAKRRGSGSVQGQAELALKPGMEMK